MLHHVIHQLLTQLAGWLRAINPPRAQIEALPSAKGKKPFGTSDAEGIASSSCIWSELCNSMFPLTLDIPAPKPQPKLPKKQWHVVLLATSARADGSYLIMDRPNHTEWVLKSAFSVHNTLTAQRSCPARSEQRCSLRREGSMSSLLSCRYTVVPRA